MVITSLGLGVLRKRNSTLDTPRLLVWLLAVDGRSESPGWRPRKGP
jgi:hypothetical protein